MRKVAYFLAFLTIATISGLIGYSAGYQAETDIPAGTAVCHALTEDSVISDCDYRNGTWYTK